MKSLVAVMVSLLLCQSSGRADDVATGSPASSVSGGEWRSIEPGGETGCALGTPFRFFYRDGPDPSRLMVYFQGGGACWDWVSCSGMFDSTVADDELNGYRGIFDFENPGNPFRQYSVVFVPYCTGDVHVGDTIARYGDDAWNAPPVQHRGHSNALAALDWVESNLSEPTRLVVTGASAGSYGALFHAPDVAERFPAAELIVIGDSGVPLLHGYPRILEQWGAVRWLQARWGPEGAEPIRVTLEAAHERVFRVRPDATIAQITTDHDAVQRAFYIFSGSPDAREVTLNLLHRLEERIPTFRAFVLSGDQHGLMRADEFYLLEENGVRLRDWIDDLVEGRSVASQYCASCD